MIKKIGHDLQKNEVTFLWGGEEFFISFLGRHFSFGGIQMFFGGPIFFVGKSNIFCGVPNFYLIWGVQICWGLNFGPQKSLTPKLNNKFAPPSQKKIGPPLKKLGPIKLKKNWTPKKLDPQIK